jgi:hypothetical protein
MARFEVGKSGNPGGRVKIATAIKAAGFDPDSLRQEVIQQLVHGMRTLNPADPKESRSWQFCVDRLDVRLNGPVREFVHVGEQPELSDADYKAECALIAAEHVASLTPDERERLLDPAPPVTIQ